MARGSDAYVQHTCNGINPMKPISTLFRVSRSELSEPHQTSSMGQRVDPASSQRAKTRQHASPTSTRRPFALSILHAPGAACFSLHTLHLLHLLHPHLVHRFRVLNTSSHLVLYTTPRSQVLRSPSAFLLRTTSSQVARKESDSSETSAEHIMPTGI